MQGTTQTTNLEKKHMGLKKTYDSFVFITLTQKLIKKNYEFPHL